MNEIHKVSLSCFLMMFFIVGCNNKRKSMLDLLGEQETKLVEEWGLPTETTGKEFSFYESASGRKMLFYKREGKEVVITVINGKVVGIGLVPSLFPDRRQDTEEKGAAKVLN